MTHRGGISFDRIAADYDVTRGGDERADLAARDLAPHLPPGRALEIGVGTGIVGAAVLRHAPQLKGLAGVDLSAAMLARARERLPGRLVRADAQRLPFAAGTFDAMVGVHILHLVADLGATLREAARVLRPGGRVVALHGPPQHRDDDELTIATRTLAPLWSGRPDTAVAVRDAARAAGLECTAQRPSTPWRAGLTPAEFAGSLESRTWSSLWDLDDDRWAATVQPAIDALRALPDQDRPRSQPGHAVVSVLTRP